MPFFTFCDQAKSWIDNNNKLPLIKLKARKDSTSWVVTTIESPSSVRAPVA